MDIFLLLQQVAHATQSSDIAPALGGIHMTDPQETTLPNGNRQITWFIDDTTRDYTIPIATWKLRLVPTQDHTGVMHIPFELELNGNDFVSLKVTVAQLELEADPKQLIAADLITQPFTFLTETAGNPPVRLLGPGLQISFAGSDLTDVGAKVIGDTGSTEPIFPSARFEPPHFIVGGTNGKLGIACDEVLLDLDPERNPAVVNATLPGVTPAWRGLFLKELGVFIGDGREAGNWCGMASMKDFFMGFDSTDITGLFTAELVHHVLDDPAQVQIEAEFGDASGDIQHTTSDVNLPLLPVGHGRIRFRAQPNWDSAGFKAAWTMPDGVSMDEPGRLSSLDTGFINVPPGDYDFTILVTDHRVPDQTVSRHVHVDAAPAEGPTTLDFILDGFPIIRDNLSERPTQRVHMRMRPAQEGVVTAHLSRGSGNPVQATITLPAGYHLLVGDATQTAQRPSNTNVYNDLAWGISAPSTVPADPDAVIIVTANDGGTEVSRRLRVACEAAPNGAPDFDLISFTDWRADPGIGLAKIEPLNGLNFSQITWTLERKPIDATLFTSEDADLFFNGAAFDVSDAINLSNSAGTVRPYLSQPNSLYRLIGAINAAPATPRTPVVIAETNALNDPVVTGAVGTDTDPFPGGTPTTIHFTYDSPEIQPTTARDGPESNSARLTLDQVNDLQAQGFVSVYQAIEQFDDQIESIAIFGAASVEGSDDHNLTLSQQRANAVKTALVTPPSELTGRMSSAASFTVPAAVQTRVHDLDGAGSIQTFAIGEHHAHTPIDPHDRRAFVILKLKDTPPVSALSHREFFVTLPGAPAPATSPMTPARVLQDHPFKHSIFRLAHVELQLLRNELIRLQIKLVLDLNANNSDDRLEAPHTSLPSGDGVTTFFLELKRDPNPPAGQPEFRWEAVALSDPTDADGFAVIQNPSLLDVIGGPTVVVPALTALSGGRTGLSGFAIAAAAGLFLTNQGLLDVHHLIWQGIRFKLRHGNVQRPTISFAVDYTVKYDMNCNLQEKLGIPIDLTTTKPIEIKFRNVGVELQSMEQVEFFYNPADGFAIDVNDPGVFRLGDSIGRLLQVRRVRSGAGSPVWFEVELGLSVDTGIFSIDTLRIRISLETKDMFPSSGPVTLEPGSINIDALSVSINKLGVSADIPGVFAGSGSLGFSGAGGGLEIEGSLDLDLIPYSLRIYGGMKFVSKDDLISIYAFLGTVFAPGIPLGNTGVAIYGFEGLFAAHMGRSNADLLAWYMTPPAGATDTNKWVPVRGSWAFGVGTVLGTVYDTGFTFNMKGGLMLELPGPKISIATQSNFVKRKPDLSSGEQGAITSVVLLDFENDIFLVGLDFVYEVPKLLRMHVPVEVFFNLDSAYDWHIRLGQWLPASKRASIRILNLFDAYGYFVVEGNGLAIPDFIDLHGICVGHGARAEIFWGSKSIGIYLEAFLEYHIGLQISPILLQGAAKVGGKLHLGPCSLGAHGQLDVKAPDPFVVRGKFCGEIDLWLFSISGCVRFTIGDGDAPIPDPPNPFKELNVMDRMTSAKVIDANACPLDAVVHLAFDQDINDGCTPPALSLSPGPFRNQVSGDLFYEYSLSSVSIVDETTGTVVDPLQKAWGPYTLPDAPPADVDSARTLRLLSWIPHPHDRAVDFEAGYGTTLISIIERLCDETRPPQRFCATFDGQPFGPRGFWDLQEPHLGHVYVVCTQSNGLGGEFVVGALQIGGGRVVPLPPVTYTNRAPMIKALRLPQAPRQFHTALDVLFPGADGTSGPVINLESNLGVDSVRFIENAVRTAAAPPSPPPAVRDRRTTAFRPPFVSASTATAVATPPERGADAFFADQIESDIASAVAARLTAADFAVRPTISGAINTNPGNQGAIFYGGLLFVMLPDLVAVDATFVLPSKTAIDGEVVFLDAKFKPVSPIFSMNGAPIAPGSTPGDPSFAEYFAKRVSLGPPMDDEKEPSRVAWMIVNPPLVSGSRVDTDSGAAFLDEICGITYGDWKAWQDRKQSIQDAIDILISQTGVVGGIPAASVQYLLDPGHTYRVDGAIDWARFKSASAGQDNGHSSSPFGLGDPRFRASTVPPKEITRYILSHDPAGYEQPHYFKERLRLTFASDVVDRIFAKFGKQLVARVKSDVEKHAVNQPMSSGTTAEFFPFGGFEVALFEALQNVQDRCLSGDWLTIFPKSVYTVPEDLRPNRGYTFTLLPRPLGEPSGLSEEEWNELLQTAQDADEAVFRYDLRTSRYGTFSEHVGTYRAGPVMDVFAEDKTTLDAALSALPNERSDEAMDALILALFGGPMKIPAAPQVIRVWVPDGPAPGPFTPPPVKCRAVILDGPEPLFKIAPNGTEQVSRRAFRLDDISDPLGEAPNIAGERWILSARGARAVLVFDEPTPPPAIGIRLLYSPVTGSSVAEELTFTVGSEPESSQEEA